jgi:hypothetical protein
MKGDWRSVVALALAVVLAGSVVVSESGCGHNPPILTPGAATALTNGLSALSGILRAQNASPAILAAISDAQVAIAQDVSGRSWGQITRTLLQELYSQLPVDVLNRPAVWAAFAAVEIVLATIGA